MAPPPSQQPPPPHCPPKTAKCNSMVYHEPIAAMARPEMLKRVASSVAALLVIAACSLVISDATSRPVSVLQSKSTLKSLRRLEHQNEHLANEIQVLQTDFEDEEKDNDRLESEVGALSSKLSGLVLRRGPQGPKGQTGDTGAPGHVGPEGLPGKVGPMGETLAALRGTAMLTRCRTRRRYWTARHSGTKWRRWRARRCRTERSAWF